MAGSLRQLQLQSKSIKNIQKLTNSMKMVAATRFKQAEKLLVAARPLGVGARKFYDLVGQESLDRSRVHYLVPFTSDRGLCGSCHYKTCKATTARLNDKQHDYRIICVGEKAKLIIGFKLGRLITLVVNGIGHRNPSFQTAAQIASAILTSDDFNEGTLYYAHFISALSYEIKQVQIFSAKVLKKTRHVAQYETDDESDVDSYVEFSLAVLIFYAMSESYGVELFSRMNAMAAASKNAGSLHQKLSQQFNMARQSLITRDLIDIVSGASVVVVKKKKYTKRRVFDENSGGGGGGGDGGRPGGSSSGSGSADKSALDCMESPEFLQTIKLGEPPPNISPVNSPIDPPKNACSGNDEKAQPGLATSNLIPWELAELVRSDIAPGPSKDCERFVRITDPSTSEVTHPAKIPLSPSETKATVPETATKENPPIPESSK